MTTKTKPTPSAARKSAAAARYAERTMPSEVDGDVFENVEALGIGATDAETIGRITRGLGGAIRMEEA